jgi:Ser/Thr protein kinase RdoA (MazF antagonist)
MKVEKAVEKVLGQEPDEVDELSEGLKHETFSVKLGDQEYIVQFSGEDLDQHNPLEQCINFYRLLKDTVPVPEIVTEKIQKIEGEKFIIVENVKGESLEQNIDQEKTRKAGEELANIHSFTEFDKTGWIEFEDKGLKVHQFKEGNLKQYKLDELEAKLEIFREEGLTELADEIEEYIKNNQDIYPEKFTPVICHDDFSPDNTIYKNGEITGIIDFDYAYSGLPARDLVKAANCYWMHDPGREWPREKFYEGYSEERPLPANFEEKEEFFRIETLVYLISGMIELGELNQDEINFYKGKLEKNLG